MPFYLYIPTSGNYYPTHLYSFAHNIVYFMFVVLLGAIYVANIWLDVMSSEQYYCDDGTWPNTAANIVISPSSSKARIQPELDIVGLSLFVYLNSPVKDSSKF